MLFFTIGEVLLTLNVKVIYLNYSKHAPVVLVLIHKVLLTNLTIYIIIHAIHLIYKLVGTSGINN